MSLRHYLSMTRNTWDTFQAWQRFLPLSVPPTLPVQLQELFVARYWQRFLPLSLPPNVRTPRHPLLVLHAPLCGPTLLVCAPTPQRCAPFAPTRHLFANIIGALHHVIQLARTRELLSFLSKSQLALPGPHYMVLRCDGTKVKFCRFCDMGSATFMRPGR
jgi:hypothetical protein